MKNSMNRVARILTTLVCTLALSAGAGCLAEDDGGDLDVDNLGAPVDVELDLLADEGEIAADGLEFDAKARPAGDDDIVLGRPGDQPEEALDDVQVDIDGAFADGPIDPTEIGDGEVVDTEGASVEPPRTDGFGRPARPGLEVQTMGRPARPDGLAPRTVNRPLRDQLGGAIGGGGF